MSNCQSEISVGEPPLGCNVMTFNIWLVVGIPTPSEKYELVNWDDDIPNKWEKSKSCSKTPTRHLWTSVYDQMQRRTGIYGHVRLSTSIPLTPKLPSKKPCLICLGGLTRHVQNHTHEHGVHLNPRQPVEQHVQTFCTRSNDTHYPVNTVWN